MVWDEPFKQPYIRTEEERELVLPVVFMNNKTNVEVEDERTVVHGRGGKGFAIVETNLVKDGCSFEWKVRNQLHSDETQMKMASVVISPWSLFPLTILETGFKLFGV